MLDDAPPSPELLAVCRTLCIVLAIVQTAAVIVALGTGHVPNPLDATTHLLFFTVLHLLFCMPPFDGRLRRADRKAATPGDIRMALHRRGIVVTRFVSRCIEANRETIATYDADHIYAVVAAIEQAPIHATRTIPILN